MNEEVSNVDNSEHPQIGRTLHFVIDNGLHVRCRIAFVVEDFSFAPNRQKGYVNLKYLTDGLNDNPDGDLGVVWKTAVLPDRETKTPGTWHWPRECAHVKEIQKED